MAQRKRHTQWTQLSDKELLELRFCDLNLSLRKSRLTPCIKTLYKELSEKNLKFKPHFWLASEWYATDGVPGIAIPFYLVHDRLIELHKNILGSTPEGADPDECLRVLRHEAGHAIDNAFHLRMSRQRQKLFGLSSTEYPESYSPRLNYKNFVSHLNPWYAQAHPDEDWAETFAIWLTPKSNWRKKYKNWPLALEKLKFVDNIMKSIGGQKPKVAIRKRPGLIIKSTKKLKTFYHEQMSYLSAEQDLDLRPLFVNFFSSSSKFNKNKSATAFLKKEKSVIVETLAQWTGQDPYTLGEIFEELIALAKEKKYHLKQTEKNTSLQLLAMLMAYSMNQIYTGQNGIKM